MACTINDIIKFPYTLDPFQHKAIQHIQKNEHVLVTAHTSAGKSTVAEFGVNWCLKQGKRILYTAPIKALSNQKYADFRKKAASGMFDCEVDDIGIITGDVQNNPDGKVIIATTEIIHNYLYSNTSYFDDVGIVVFDEVHYINDPDRGKVWEGSIVMMPSHIIMVMLSATIPKAEQFAEWIQSVKMRNVGLVTTEYRPVPLTHSIFWNDTFHVICNDKKADTETYEKIRRSITEMYKPAAKHSSSAAEAVAARNAARKSGQPIPPPPKVKKPPSEGHLLNQAVRRLEEADKLPGFFFCFSRKKCHAYANTVQHPVSDGKTLTNGVNRFRSLIQKHVHKDDHKLHQIIEMEKFIGKGVAVHHSGLLPILKEIVEKLFEEKYIQVLFVTETFAVGINLATRCVVLTDVRKHDGIEKRTLASHEYQQISGRAGRRGLDTAGTVVLLPLQPPLLPTTEAFDMIIGAKQPIQSKFKLDAHFLLTAMLSETQTVSKVLLSTLMSTEISHQAQVCQTQMESAILSMPSKGDTALFDDPKYIEYIRLKEITNQPHKQAKMKRRANNALQEHIATCPYGMDAHWEVAETIHQTYLIASKKKEALEHESERLTHYLRDETNHMLQFLKSMGYLTLPPTELDQYSFETIDTWGANTLTIKGKTCTIFQECSPYLTTEWILKGKSDHLTGEEIVMVLATMLGEKTSTIWVTDRALVPEHVQAVIDDLYNMNESLAYYHVQSQITTYPSLEIVSHMAEYAALWLDDSICIAELMTRVSEPIDEGNFVKSMLKLYNMVEELKKAYALIGHANESKLVGIAPRLLRDTVRVDSLYY